MAVDVETNLDTDVKIIDTVDSTDDTVDTTDTNSNNIADILPENLAAIPGAEELILSNTPEFRELNNGNVVVVWDNKNAWVFNLELNSITHVTDYDAMLAVADTTGRGREYFDSDLSLSLDVPHESETQIRIVLNVTGDEGCEYSVYTYYSKNGHLTDYYCERIIYPGSDEPVYITDIDDYAKLGISDEIAENSYVFRTARAIIENDVDSLKSLMPHRNNELFDAWEGMEISEHCVYRMPPIDPYRDDIWLNVKIEKSNVEGLPPGEYSMHIYDGININVDIENLNEPEVSVETEAASWISPFVRAAGSFAPEEMVVTNENYVHALLDSTIWYYNDDEPLDLNGFAEFCEKYFNLDDVEKHYTNGYITNHGGHGLASFLFEIKKDAVVGDTHTVTVDFFADPMATVVAKTYEYTLVDIGDGEFRLDGVDVTYDSGYTIYGWST